MATPPEEAEPQPDVERITPADTTNILLVEGREDKEAVEHLLTRCGLRGACRVEAGGGYETLRRVELRVRIKAGETGHRLGVIVDADRNQPARWQSLRDVLWQEGYSAPNGLDADGIVLTEPDRMTVGVWMMPDNASPGALEDFVRSLIPADDVLWIYAEKVITDLPMRHFPETALRKAELYSWLAWQREPGRPIGQAITKRFLTTEASNAQRFVTWVKRLLDLETREAAI